MQRSLFRLVLLATIAVSALGALPAMAQPPAPPVPPEVLLANKAVVQQIFDQVYSQGNTDLVNTLFAENYVQSEGDETLGREAFAENVSSLRTAFPDLTATVENLLAEGDLVFARATLTGTQQGIFEDVDVTGLPVTFQTMHIFRLEQGRIVESWNGIDTTSILQQLGVEPVNGDMAQFPTDGTMPQPPADGQLPDVAQLGESTLELAPEISLEGPFGPNKALTLNVYNAFTTKDVSTLGQVVAEDYIQHNPMVGQGLEGLRNFITQTPPLPQQTTITHLIAEGEFVAVRVESSLSLPGLPEPATYSAFDLYRVENNLLAEHWDVVSEALRLLPPTAPQS
jgi:steroid delta-isomerase-like uncharacterized protein